MRNQEDLPYILVERDSSGSFGSFCLGALVGAGLALLFAPQSGEETQEEIRARAQKLRAAAEERMREAQLTLEDRLENVREGVESRVELGKQLTYGLMGREGYDPPERSDPDVRWRLGQG